MLILRVVAGARASSPAASCSHACRAVAVSFFDASPCNVMLSPVWEGAVQALAHAKRQVLCRHGKSTEWCLLRATWLTYTRDSHVYVDRKSTRLNSSHSQISYA